MGRTYMLLKLWLIRANQRLGSYKQKVTSALNSVRVIHLAKSGLCAITNCCHPLIKITVRQKTMSKAE